MSCEVNGSCPAANENKKQQWLLGQGVSLRTGTADGVLLHLKRGLGDHILRMNSESVRNITNRITKVDGKEILLCSATSF